MFSLAKIFLYMVASLALPDRFFLSSQYKRKSGLETEARLYDSYVLPHMRILAHTRMGLSQKKWSG